MYIKIVDPVSDNSMHTKNKYGNTYEVGKVYHSKENKIHFVTKEGALGAYKDYYASHATKPENVRFLEIEPLDKDFKENNLYFGRSGSHKIKVVREVPLDQVISVKDQLEIEDFYKETKSIEKNKEGNREKNKINLKQHLREKFINIIER